MKSLARDNGDMYQVPEGLAKNTQEEFDEVVHNSELFDALDKPHEILDESSDESVVDWQEYHPMTDEQIEQGYDRIYAAPDYSNEPEK